MRIRKKELTPEELQVLIERFVRELIPIAVENEYTLHELFSYCRFDAVKYGILRELYRTHYGEYYLKSAFRGYRGQLSKKYLKSVGL